MTTDFRLFYDSTSVDDIQTLLDFSYNKLFTKSKEQKPILVRVLTSGKNNPQLKAFRVVQGNLALQNPRTVVTFEYLGKSELIQQFRGKTPKDLVDWLLGADVHYLLGHIHQGGVFEELDWSVKELYTELKRLRYHPGAPWGLKTDCPIANQDKIGYIEACSEITNPTLFMPVKELKFRRATDFECLEWYCLNCKKFNTPFVDTDGSSFVKCEHCSASRPNMKRKNLPTSFHQRIKFRRLPIFSEAELETLKSFCSQYNEGYGWVVKAPFTTNCSCRYFAKSPENVITYLEKICLEYGPNESRGHSLIPYVLIQPCMKNMKEYKVLVFDAKPLYVLSSKSGKRRIAFCDKDEDLLTFARDAVEILKKNCKHAIVDGLIRVDIFCNAAGKWKVNEFEGYEADFCTSNTDDEAHVLQLLETYWKSSLSQFVYM